MTNIIIDLGPGQLIVPRQAIIDFVLHQTLPARTFPPPIGHVWPGEYAIYAGVMRGQDGRPDYYLLVPLEPGERESIEWPDAMEWTKSVGLALPNRQEARILWANVPELFKKAWYWLSTQYAGLEGRAWAQTFGSGDQLDYHKDYDLRARPVRRLPVGEQG